MLILPGVHAEPLFTPCASSYNLTPLLPCVCLVWGRVSVLVSCLVPLFPSENGIRPWIPADLVWLASPLLRDWIVAHLPSHSVLQISRLLPAGKILERTDCVLSVTIFSMLRIHLLSRRWQSSDQRMKECILSFFLHCKLFAFRVSFLKGSSLAPSASLLQRYQVS